MATPRKTSVPKPETLTVEARPAGGGSHVDFGVEYNGAWFPLNTFVDTDVQARVDAAAAADAAASSDSK